MAIKTRLKELESKLAAVAGHGKRTLAELLTGRVPIDTMTDDELAMLATGDPMATAVNLDEGTLAAIVGHNLEV